MYILNLQKLRTALGIAALLLILSAASAAITWAQACDAGNNNIGQWITFYCVNNMCDENPDNDCEEDICGGGCGSGYLVYCVASVYCGDFPGCLNQSCA